MRDLNLKVKEIISKNFNINKNDLSINFIDHSILDRNYVYIFSVEKEEYVIKISYNYEKWTNEINVLKLLKDNFFVPKILNYGNNNNLKYIIMKKIPGDNLVDSISNFSENKKLSIIHEIGKNLALIHKTGKYNYYSWNEKTMETSLIETRK